MKFLKSWQGVLTVIGATLAAIVTIITQSTTVWNFVRSFFPAELEVAMTSCKFDDLKVEIVHRGGPATMVGPPSYRIHTKQRPNDILLADRYSLDRDRFKSNRRLVQPRSDQQEGVTSYHYGGRRAVFYNGDEMDAGGCTIALSLPAEGRTRPIEKTCQCGR